MKPSNFENRSAPIFDSTIGVLKRFVAIGVVAAACVGCSNEPFPIVKIEGKITYEDGEPIPADSIMLRFIPQVDSIDEKTHARAGNATVDVNDGRIEQVTTHKYNDGIVRGTHKVLVKANASATVVPDEYTQLETTPLIVESRDAPFHLKVKRPDP